MPVQTEIELLRDIPIFSHVEDAHLQLLSFSAKRRRFATGQALLTKGEPGKAAYLIVSGRANAHSGKDAKSPKLFGVESGSLVGELAMIVAQPHAISIVAAQDVEAKEISRELFKRVSLEFPAFGQSVLLALSAKLDTSLAELQELQDLFG